MDEITKLKRRTLAVAEIMAMFPGATLEWAQKEFELHSRRIKEEWDMGKKRGDPNWIVED
jgi:hypothetical protein